MEKSQFTISSLNHHIILLPFLSEVAFEQISLGLEGWYTCKQATFSCLYVIIHKMYKHFCPTLGAFTQVRPATIVVLKVVAFEFLFQHVQNLSIETTWWQHTSDTEMWITEIWLMNKRILMESQQDNQSATTKWNIDCYEPGMLVFSFCLNHLARSLLDLPFNDSIPFWIGLLNIFSQNALFLKVLA